MKQEAEKSTAETQRDPWNSWKWRNLKEKQISEGEK